MALPVLLDENFAGIPEIDSNCLGHSISLPMTQTGGSERAGAEMAP
jgi:hypothetical protein